MPESRDLVAHARDTRVVVVGGGVAGAVAALECAKVGMTVTLLEAEGDLGGALRAADLGGVEVDALVDGFAPGGIDLAGLLVDLGLDGEVVVGEQSSIRISGLPGRVEAAPVPADSVLGIPANPWDAAVRRVIGWGGAWRAYVDRLRPPLTIGRERNLGALVRTRMGDAVCDRLVAPVTRARLGLDPHEVDADIAAPGLNTALTRTGSLAGAVTSLTGRPAGRATLAGGMHRIATALAERLAQFDVEVRTGVRVTGLRHHDDGWTVAASASDEELALRADAVVLAVPEGTARDLLDGVVRLPETIPARAAEVVVLRLKGTTAGGGRTVVAPVVGDVWRVADVAASSPAVAAAVPEGERIVRVEIVPAEGAATATTDETAIARALAAASDAGGTPVAAADVRAAVRLRPAWHPSAQLDRRDRSRTAREVLHGIPSLAVTGAWLSGDGLDEVVADAVTEADRLRSRALWGGDGAPASPGAP